MLLAVAGSSAIPTSEWLPWNCRLTDENGHVSMVKGAFETSAERLNRATVPSEVKARISSDSDGRFLLSDTVATLSLEGEYIIPLAIVGGGSRAFILKPSGKSNTALAHFSGSSFGIHGGSVVSIQDAGPCNMGPRAQ